LSHTVDIPSVTELWMNQNRRQQFKNIIRRGRKVIKFIQNRPETTHYITNLQQQVNITFSAEKNIQQNLTGLLLSICHQLI